MDHRLSNRFLRLAVVFGVIGMVWGAYMGATMSFETKTVHAHLNLVGWVTSALFGLAYRALPHAAHGRLPQVQFWLHAVGLPIFTLSLAAYYLGGIEVEQMALAGLAIGPNLVVLSTLLFAVVIFRATSARASAPTP